MNLRISAAVLALLAAGSAARGQSPSSDIERLPLSMTDAADLLTPPGGLRVSIDLEEPERLTLVSPELELQEPPPRRQVRMHWSSIHLSLRALAISGELDPFLEADYDDLFDGGAGVGLEGRLLWRMPGDWWAGGYAAINWDTYDGDRFTDFLGDTLDADDMDILTVVLGVRAAAIFGPGFFVDGQIGLGIVHYDTVDGVATFSGSPQSVTIFDETTTVCFDMGVRFGFGSGPFVADLGLTIRFQGAPDNADFDFDSENPAVGILDIGIGWRF